MMSKNQDFQIDLEIHKLELDGIDKILDIVKLIVAIGTPACAALLSQGFGSWWQGAAFGILFGVVLGDFVELFKLTGDRNAILSEMKAKYLKEKTKPKRFFARLSGKTTS